jgi:hypothetical protein
MSQKPLPFAEVPRLELIATFADLWVVPVATGETPRVVASEGGEEHLRVSVVDDVVVVQFDGPDGPFWGKRAHQKLTLHVPPNVRARVRSDLGRVHIERLDQGCDLEVSTSAGAVQLSHVAGRMVLRAGAGAIQGDHLAGVFDVETSAGAVKLSIVALADGAHRVHTNMGSARVDLTPGVAVRLETRTSMGSIRKRFNSTADAPAVLSVSTELGSVKIGEAEEEDERHGDYARWDALPPLQEATHGHDPRADSPRWDSLPPVLDPSRWASALAHALGPPPARPQPPERPEPPARRINDEELNRILTMVEQGKINAQDAERLIRAIEAR